MKREKMEAEHALRTEREKRTLWEKQLGDLEVVSVHGFFIFISSHVPGPVGRAALKARAG